MPDSHDSLHVVRPDADLMVTVESTHMFDAGEVFATGADRTWDETARDAIELVIDALPYYVMLVSESHSIVMANRATQTAMKMSQAELVGVHCPRVVHGVDGRYPGCPLEVAVGTRKAVERVVFDKATDRWLVSSVFPTRYVTENDERIYLHTVRDITESKRADMALRGRVPADEPSE